VEPEMKLQKFTQAPLGADLNTIQCHLEHFNFDKHPLCIALSHTWSEISRVNEIIVDDAAFTIRGNLHNFFSHGFILRSSHGYPALG
jgi:hypothetical protein